MKLLKAILFKLILIVMVCIVAFNLYNFICLNVLKEDLATVNGYAVLEVVSGSMEPTIHVGDMIIIDTKVENYEKDDIITFYDVNGAFVTHRIINITGDKMVTQGDNNQSPDEEMSTDNIVGKVVNTIPSAGKILASLKSPLVMGLILIIGILVCFLTSTDDNLVPVDLTDEEKEFLEYKKNKVLQAKANNVNFVDYTEPKKRKSSKKSTTDNNKEEEIPKKDTPKSTKKTTKVAGTKKTNTKTKATPVVKEVSKKEKNIAKPKTTQGATKKVEKTTKTKDVKSTAKKANSTKTKNVKTSPKTKASAKGEVKKTTKVAPKKASSKVEKTSKEKAVKITSKVTKKATKKETAATKKSTTAVKKTTKVEKKPVKKTVAKKSDVKTVKNSTKKTTGAK